jgi:hypothetical protein
MCRRLLDITIECLHQNTKRHLAHTFGDPNQRQIHGRAKVARNGFGIRPNQFAPRRYFAVELGKEHFG